MSTCAVCGTDVSKRAFRCSGCDSLYCADHRRGRKHDCSTETTDYEVVSPEQIRREKEQQREQGEKQYQTREEQQDGERTATERSRVEILTEQQDMEDPTNVWIFPAITTWTFIYGTLLIAVLYPILYGLHTVLDLGFLLEKPAIYVLFAATFPIGVAVSLTPISFLVDYVQLKDRYEIHPIGITYFLATFFVTSFVTAFFYTMQRRRMIGRPRPLHEYLREYWAKYRT